jgi:hypothetical protein
MAKTLFDAIKETDNATTTTNGMSAYKSSLNKVLDLFAKGASHRKTANAIPMMVRDAYLEDKLTTVRCLFYLRDIRGGQGEREVFRKGIHTVAELDPKTFINSNLISHIPTYGRWDDLFCLFGVHDELDEQIINFVTLQMTEDVANYKEDKPISIMAKWLPSVNTSSKKTRMIAKKLVKALGITEKLYRKTLSKLRKRINILETYLTNKDYTFDYSTVPSNANMKYRKCFYEKDGERFRKHVDAVTKALDSGCTNPTVKDNVKALYPYEIVGKFIGDCSWRWHSSNLPQTEKQRLENMWKQLPNYFSGESGKKNWLTVIDTSGSMLGFAKPSPMEVAISLGLYIGERNTGIFKDKYITFSEHPSFVTVDSKWKLESKIKHIVENSIIANTNLERVFSLVLDAAVSHDLPKSEMPEAIVIISDMQFDSCVEDGNNPTAYEMITKKYRDAGYPVPKLVFWNVAQADKGNLPVTQHKYGAVLVGGCKPGLFEQILSGKTPVDFMMQVLESERYNVITLSE